MNRVFRMIAIIMLLAAIALGALSIAEGAISTTVVMRVSHATQSAVVNVGEDLSMEVNVSGVTPTAYQWYKDDVELDGENQKVYTIVNAQVGDSGVYRMDAFDANGKMLVSMDISARVIDPAVPKSGDDSIPLSVVAAVMACAAVTMLIVFRRRKQA